MYLCVGRLRRNISVPTVPPVPLNREFLYLRGHLGHLGRVRCGATTEKNGERRSTAEGGEPGGEGIVVMKASRSEAAREAVRADESNLPHARRQGQAPGGRRSRPSCGAGDAAGATWLGRRRRGPASLQRGGEHAAERTEQDTILAVLRRREGLRGGVRLSLLGAKEEAGRLSPAS